MISIIVCTYNRAESLRETLSALRAQLIPKGQDVEMLVVDNNSSDHTKSVVGDALTSNGRPVQYAFEPIQGVSHARNLGIRASRGEFICFTDDDVLPEPNWVEALYDGFVVSGVDCVGGKILPLWMESPPPWASHERIRGGLYGALSLLDHGASPIITNRPAGNFLYGGNIAFRKDVLEQVGYFHTDFGPKGGRPARGEDTEMLYRFSQNGRRVMYTPKAVVHHKVPPYRLTMQYLRQLRRSTGYAMARLSEVESRKIPFWLIRECLENGAGALWNYGTKQLETGIEREFQFWAQIGQIVGTLQGHPHDRRWQNR